MAQPSGGTARYKQGIKRTQKQLDETYRALGMLSHEQSKMGQIGGDAFNRLTNEVDRLLAEIKDSQEAMERLKLERQVTRGPLVCPACGLRAPGIRYCPSCGIDMTIPLQAEASEIECPNCGQLITADSVFCGICGAKVERPVPEDEQPEEPVESTSITNNWSLAGTVSQDHGGEQLQSNRAEAKAEQSVPEGENTQEPVESTFITKNWSLAGTVQDHGVQQQGRCPKCGDVLEPGAVFCVSCGTTLTPQMPSPSIGTGRKTYVVECSDCGWQGLDSETVPRPGSTGELDEDGVCPACGSENWDFTNRPVPAESCPVATTVKCGYCGELAEIGTQFCLNCGQSLGG